MTAKFPIEKAGPLRTTGAVQAPIRIDPSIGSAGAAVGQAVVAGLGFAQRIQQKRREMTDANSTVAAQQQRNLADEKFRQFKLLNPQETWTDERERLNTEATTAIDTLDFSEAARQRQNIIMNGTEETAGYSEISNARALTDATRQLRTDTIETQTAALVEAFAIGNPERILAQTKLFIAQGDNMGKDKNEVLNDIKEAQKEGEKQRKFNINNLWSNMIAEDPSIALDQDNPTSLASELNLRKDGKGNIPEDVLSSKNIQSLINTATNRQTQLTAQVQADLNAVNSATETRLHDEILNKRASITDIQASGLPAAIKRRLEKDLADVAERDVARTWAIQDASETTTGVNNLLLSVESGTLDINEARTKLGELREEQTTDGRSKMTSKTYRSTMDKISKGGRDAIDIFTDEQSAKVDNFLTKRLTDQQARLQVRADAGTLTSSQRRQFSAVGFLLQVATHQKLLYDETLANNLRRLGIEDTSGNEAKAEAVKVWESQRGKPLTAQINDFLSASGQKLVRPEGFPNDVWERSGVRQRSSIIIGISKKFDNDKIIEAINVVE